MHPSDAASVESTSGRWSAGAPPRPAEESLHCPRSQLGESHCIFDVGVAQIYVTFLLSHALAAARFWFTHLGSEADVKSG